MWPDGIHMWNLLHLSHSAPAQCFWIRMMNTVPPESAELGRREESHLSPPLTSSRTGIIYWCWAVNIQHLMLSVAPPALGFICAGYRLEGGGREGGDARTDKMEAKQRRRVSLCLLPEKLNHRLDFFTNKRQTVHPELQRQKKPKKKNLWSCLAAPPSWLKSILFTCH